MPQRLSLRGSSRALGTVSFSPQQEPPAPLSSGGGPEPLATYTVEGVFQYEDRELNHTGFTGATWMSPVRYADVEVIDNDTGAVLATTNTNDTGYLSVSVTDTITRNVTVRALTSSQYQWRLFNQSVVTTASLGSQVYELRSPVYVDHPPTGSIDFVSSPVNATKDDVGGAFHIFDLAEHAEDYVENLTGEYPIYPLTVEWAKGEDPGKYYGLNGHVYLGGTASDDDSYDDNIILHEIGHYIALTYSVDAGYYGGHSITGIYDIRLTYTEGLGSYFLGAVRNFMNVLQPLIYVETDGVSLSWYGFSMPLDTDTPSGYSGDPLPTYTAANEVTVAHALYDVVDGVFSRDGTEGFDDDTLDLPNMEGDKLIWDVLVAIKDNETKGLLTKEISMETFADIWIDIGQYVPEFLQILQAHKIEYFEDAYEQDDDPASATPIPTDGTVHHHTYYPAGDPDWSAFAGNQGEEYVMKTSDLLDGADTVLELYDTDGMTLLASNNDWEPPSKHSLIAFSPAVGGQYYLRSYRFAETPKPIGEYGNYNISIHILDNPEISSVAPNTGPVAGGTFVSIGGNNFTAGATVLFGVYQAANVVVLDANTISATSPANVPGPVNVTVVNPPNADNVVSSGTVADAFTYTGAALPPILRRITPDFGSTSASTNVTVEGDYLQAGATLYFNAVEAASYTVIDPRTVRATVQPLPQDLYDVNVTNPDAQYDVLERGFESTVQGYNDTDVVFGDWSTITSTMEISEDFVISDLYVYVNLTAGDITYWTTITLESPTGTVVFVCERIEATDSWGQWRTRIDSTFGYDEPPSEGLWSFKGESTKGNWTLSITAMYGDPNTLHSWGITFFKYRHRDITRMVYVVPEWRNYVLAVNEVTGELLYRARLEGYPGWPMSVAVTSDRRYVYASTWTEYNATLSDWVDSHLSIFEAGTGRRIKDMNLYGNMVNGCLLAVPDSDRLVALTSENVYLFNTTTHTIIGNVSLPTEGDHLGVAPDGRKAYVPSATGSYVDVIDLELFSVVGQIPTPGYNPSDVDVASDGTFGVITGSSSTQQQVLIFNTTSDAVVSQVDTTSWGLIIELTPDNTKAFFTIYQWYAGVGVVNLTTGAAEVLQISPSMTSNSLVISDDFRVYTPDWDGAHNDLVIWNARDNTFIKKIHMQDAGNPNGVAYGDGVGKVMNLKAAGGNGNITLTWDEPESPGTPISSYKVYRGDSSRREVFLAEIAPSTTHLDIGLTNGQTYYYRVSAVNGRGEGPLSEEASATPNFYIPQISKLNAQPDPQFSGGSVNVTCTVTVGPPIAEVWVNVTLPGGGFSNSTMARVGTTDDYYYEAVYTQIGTHAFLIWARNTEWTWNVSAQSSFEMIESPAPPEISEVSASPDPQARGGFVNVSANVSDASGVGGVWLNVSFPGGGFSNSSMSRAGATDHYYLNASYGSLGLHQFTIWADDTGGNWNLSASPSQTFTIVDVLPPEISSVQDAPDPQSWGYEVNISADVVDDDAVAQVWINVTLPGGGSTNASMTRFGLADTYYLNATYSIIGAYSYVIWASDASGNWNYSSSPGHTFDIVDLWPPQVLNAQDVPDPQAKGGYVNISATVIDDIALDQVRVNVSLPGGGWSNASMTRLDSTDIYYYNTTYSLLGLHAYSIWTNDTSGNWAMSTGYDFTVIDVLLPVIGNLKETPDPQVWGNPVNISADVTDDTSVDQVWVNVSLPGGGYTNSSMTRAGASDTFYCVSTNSTIGPFSYTIWAADAATNWASGAGSFALLDVEKPELENLQTVPQVQELFGRVNVSVEASDDYALFPTVWLHMVLPGGTWANESMSLIAPDTWYSDREYALPGSYTLTIWARDTSGNWNSTFSSFQVQDTTAPTADAGPDREIDVGDTVQFNGSGSSDNSGAVANYTWTVYKDGVQVVVLYGVTPSHAFAAPGNYTVKLVVLDPSGNPNEDSLYVLVSETTAPDVPQGGNGIWNLIWLLIAGAVAAMTIIILLYLLKRRRQTAEEKGTEEEREGGPEEGASEEDETDEERMK